jgi:CRISPR/Cas system-associated protein endoribonuclease Cas2
MSINANIIVGNHDANFVKGLQFVHTENTNIRVLIVMEKDFVHMDM